MKLIHEAQTELLLHENKCIGNIHPVRSSQPNPCMLAPEKMFLFLSIRHAFWYFDFRKPWNINGLGYPAMDKNKKAFAFFFLLLGSDSSLSDQTSTEEKKEKKNKCVFDV